jgi:hypothetical protein
MTEYRQEAAAKAAATARQGRTTTTVTPPSTSAEIPAFMGLAQRYGMADMRLGPDPVNHDVQSVEQEYQAYVSAAPSPVATNIIKFWEVRIVYSLYIEM